MRGAICAAGLLASFATAPTASAEPLRPHDFARGRVIETSGEAPLQTLLLDLPVYQGSIEPSLADVRVMNGAGEPVPHAVRQLTRSSPQEAGSRALPFFALREGDTGQPLPESVEAGSGMRRAYRIRAEVSDDGALVEVESEPPGALGAPAPAYLLDASQLERAVVRLDFDLTAGDSGFVVPVRVEGSDDLRRFTPLVERGVLVRLRQDGHQINKTHIELPATKRRYLRLSWPAAPLPVGLEAVRARLQPRLASPARERTRLVGRAVEDEDGTQAFVFDLGGRVPIDRAQVLLPQTNTLVQARLMTAREAEGPWRARYSGLLYELQYGETLRNDALHWTAQRERFLKLVVEPGGGGLGAGTPMLEVSWRPEQLLFIRRGEAPFQLVYGRSGAEPTPFDTAELLEAWPTPKQEPPRASAHLGDEIVLGGPSVLEPPAPPPPYRTWALWAVLVLAVGAVLGMSVSLLRQMRSRS